MRLTKGVGVIAALLLLTMGTSAKVKRLELSDLATGASEIVVGRIIAVQPEWRGAKIISEVTIDVSQTWKGNEKEEITFDVPGGTIGTISMHSGEAPKLRVGEDVVLFLRRDVCDCDVYGWFQGKLTVVDGSIREMKNTTLAQLHQAVEGHLDAAEPEGR